MSPPIHLLPRPPLLVCPRAIQRRQDLLRRPRRNVRDKQKGISKGRRGELVVLREGPRVDVEALRAGVGDDDVGDGGPGVVDGERDGEGEGGEEGEEGVVGGEGVPGRIQR